MFTTMIMFSPIVPVFGIFILMWLFLFAFNLYFRRKKRRSPVAENLPRAPGQSLMESILELSEEITVHATFLWMFPLVLYSAYLSMLYFGGKRMSAVAIAAIAGMICIGAAYSFFKLSRLLGKRRLLRLGYDGEVATGQELNRLMHQGYHVFHDFPADGFNIDHIVVGAKGLFSIETKARSKPTTLNRREDATVEYNGRLLYFPFGKDLSTVEQAERQAVWLSRWISGAVGETVMARAVVALPGWVVKRVSSEGIPVVNPKQLASLFDHIKPRHLDGQLVTRIVHQLEQRCRDVAPFSKIYEKATSG